MAFKKYAPAFGQFALKVILAGLILFWTFKKGKLDFSIVVQSFDHPWRWCLAFGLLFTALSLGSWRWKRLLEIAPGSKFSFFSIFKVTWIGLFFNSILPGAVSGDIVKLYYARELDHKLSKTYLLTTIFLDRVFGLLGLLLLLGITSLFFSQDLLKLSPEFQKLLWMDLILFVGMLFSLTFFFIPVRYQANIINLTHKVPYFGSTVGRIFTNLWTVGQEKGKIISSILISMFNHILYISAFWILASPYFEKPLEWKYAFTFIPLGMVSVAIPITPAGIGIGHVVFGKLFSYFGINNGVSLFNFYVIATVGINSLGLFPYLFAKKKRTSEHPHLSQTAGT